MEQFIILLIWLGMGLFGLIAKARNKQRDQNPAPPPDDWLDDQWQELVQTREEPSRHPTPASDEGNFSNSRQTASQPEPPALHAPPAPPPLPPIVPTQPQPMTPPTGATPASSTIELPPSLAAEEIGARPKRRGHNPNRRTAVKDLLHGRNALRRTVLLREVVDRPRAYDV